MTPKFRESRRPTNRVTIVFPRTRGLLKIPFFHCTFSKYPFAIRHFQNTLLPFYFPKVPFYHCTFPKYPSYSLTHIYLWVKARYGVTTFGQNFSTNLMRRKEKYSIFGLKKLTIFCAKIKSHIQ